jgi:hypothetical protein
MPVWQMTAFAALNRKRFMTDFARDVHASAKMGSAAEAEICSSVPIADFINVWLDRRALWKSESVLSKANFFDHLWAVKQKVLDLPAGSINMGGLELTPLSRRYANDLALSATADSGPFYCASSSWFSRSGLAALDFRLPG